MPKCSWQGANLAGTVVGSKCDNCGHRDLIHDWDGCAMCEFKDLVNESRLELENKNG